MAMVEFMELKRPVTKNINQKILSQTIHILHNINLINLLFLQCN